MGFIEANSENWDKQVAHSVGLTVVDFWHEQCHWCKLLEPVLEQLSDEFGETVRFAKFDVLASEANWQVANSLGIYASPTLAFYCNGHRVGVLTGFRPKSLLRGEIERHSDQCNLACR